MNICLVVLIFRCLFLGGLKERVELYHVLLFRQGGLTFPLTKLAVRVEWGALGTLSAKALPDGKDDWKNV